MKPVDKLTSHEIQLEIVRFKGWVLLEDQHVQAIVDEKWKSRGGDHYGLKQCPWDNFGKKPLSAMSYPMPEYATNMADAELLLDEMKAVAEIVDIKWATYEPKWQCYFLLPHKLEGLQRPPNVMFDGAADTMPMAIARCYIEWKRSTKGKTRV